MNIVLWIVAVVLAVIFGGAGTLKATQPKAKLAESMGWVNDFSSNAVKTIGGLEILAAIGLILPAVTRIAPVLVPLSASGLAIVMAGAIAVHARRNESQMIMVNFVLLVLAVFVAWGRFGPYAL
ncbi:MAG: DoxX family protein [Gordonia sp. (in: high G+C Gram-positive bacteria)]|uniref:DoxX family protein n=1 Tax=Gordonia sp. (in: high G+C Gram-positive bacteria) TaxID=84139 RepID=UPI003C720B10